ARHDAHLSTASHILQHWRFNSTDAARAARKTLAGILQKEPGKLSPSQVDYFVTWVWSDAGMESDDWKKIAAEIRKRWDAEKKPEVKHQLAQPLVRILGLLGPDEAIAFHRVQWKEASDE